MSVTASTPSAVSDARPFRIDIPEPVLQDLRERLARTRWSSSLAGTGWGRGVDPEFLRELCARWAEFDWRAVEERLNALPQLSVEVDGLATHCVHVRSPHDHAVPLLLTHGWPSTFAEFQRVVGPLTDPSAYGGDPADAFHVVVPSLPGYGFSEAPREAGFDIRAAGNHLVRLMEQLGYDRFLAHGSDWGAMATHWMALDAPDKVTAIHLTLLMAFPPPDAHEDPDLTARERERLARIVDLATRSAHTYATLQGTLPHSLAPALSDSPAGLAAWVVDKFHTWTDHQGDLLQAVSVEDLLTDLTIYWATNTIGSSVELYYESTQAGTMAPPPSRVEVPTGGLLLPRDILGPARKWAEPLFNVVHWTEADTGGHFPAIECPETLVADIRDHFRSFR